MTDCPSAATHGTFNYCPDCDWLEDRSDISASSTLSVLQLDLAVNAADMFMATLASLERRVLAEAMTHETYKPAGAPTVTITYKHPVVRRDDT